MAKVQILMSSPNSVCIENGGCLRLHVGGDRHMARGSQTKNQQACEKWLRERKACRATRIPNGPRDGRNVQTATYSLPRDSSGVNVPMSGLVFLFSPDAPLFGRNVRGRARARASSRKRYAAHQISSNDIGRLRSL